MSIVALGIAALPASVLAQDAPRTPTALDLAWNAPDGCPTREALIEHVSRLLGRPPLPPAGERLAIHADVSMTEPAGWQLVLRIESSHGEGERTLRGEQCGDVADAAALMIALAIDPQALVTQPPVPAPIANPATATVAPVPPPPAPVVVPAPETPVRPPASPREFIIRAFAGIDLGTLPAPSPGAGLSLGLVLGRARFDVGVTLWNAQHAAAGVDVGLGAVMLAACYSPFGASLTIGACVSGEIGAMTGTGTGAVTAQTVTQPWIALLAGPTLTWRTAARWSVRADLALGATLLAPEFVVVDRSGQDQTVFRPGNPVGRGTIGIEMRF